MKDKANLYLILGFIFLVVPVVLLLMTESEDDVRARVFFAVLAAGLILLIEGYRQRKIKK